jgi:hypothetical protein
MILSYGNNRDGNIEYKSYKLYAKSVIVFVCNSGILN